MSPPLLWGRPTSPLTLTVHHAPHGLLTVVRGAAAALAAAPQLSLTAPPPSPIYSATLNGTFQLRCERPRLLSAPLLRARPASPLTLTVRRTPHGLLTVVSAAAGALAAAPQLSLTAAVGRDKATSHTWRLRVDNEFFK